MYVACFRVSLKHAFLWVETFKKWRLKGLQMDRGRVRSMFQG